MYAIRSYYEPAWRDLVASVPVCAVWDDHVYWSDDGWGIPKGYTKEDHEGIWEVFRRSWNNPSYGFGDEGPGIAREDRTRVFERFTRGNVPAITGQISTGGTVITSYSIHYTKLYDPFDVLMRATYRLTATGLHVQVSARR